MDENEIQTKYEKNKVVIKYCLENIVCKKTSYRFVLWYTKRKSVATKDLQQINKINLFVAIAVWSRDL